MVLKIDAIDTVMHLAQMTYEKRPNWVQFARTVNDAIALAFNTGEERIAFHASAHGHKIRGMIARLRSQPDQNPEKEITRVITVRLPASLHEALVLEAADRRTSLNNLCITKLLQGVQDELVSRCVGEGPEREQMLSNQ